MKIRDTHLSLKQPPILPTPPFLREKSDPHPFGENPENSTPLYKSGGVLLCSYLVTMPFKAFSKIEMF